MHFVLVAGMYLKSCLGAGVFTPAENVPKVISVDICDRSLTMTGMHSSPKQAGAHSSFCQVIINKGDHPENLELLMAPELYEVWNRETLLAQRFLLCLSLALFFRSWQNIFVEQQSLGTSSQHIHPMYLPGPSHYQGQELRWEGITEHLTCNATMCLTDRVSKTPP